MNFDAKITDKNEFRKRSSADKDADYGCKGNKDFMHMA